jgi:hypothetical protein
MYKASIPHPLPHLLSLLCIADILVGVAHCDFDLHCSNYQWFYVSVYILAGYLHIFFGEIPASACSFLYRVIYLFIVEF